MAAHLGNSMPLPILLVFGGAVTALVAILIGLPALRMPGLFLAVSTLGFAIFMQEAVLATPCITVPGINKELCTGLPNPASTLINAGPRCSGCTCRPSGPSPTSPWASC